MVFPVLPVFRKSFDKLQTVGTTKYILSGSNPIKYDLLTIIVRAKRFVCSLLLCLFYWNMRHTKERRLMIC